MSQAWKSDIAEISRIKTAQRVHAVCASLRPSRSTLALKAPLRLLVSGPAPPRTGTFSEHLERYGGLIRRDSPATDEHSDGARVWRRAPQPRLSTKRGRLEGHLDQTGIDPNIISAQRLLELRNHTDAFMRLQGLDITSILRHNWWNDRPAFRPEIPLEPAVEGAVDAAIREYRCLGHLCDEGEHRCDILTGANDEFSTVYYPQNSCDGLGAHLVALFQQQLGTEQIPISTARQVLAAETASDEDFSFYEPCKELN